jgi:hypothetical protein
MAAVANLSQRGLENRGWMRFDRGKNIRVHGNGVSGGYEKIWKVEVLF